MCRLEKDKGLVGASRRENVEAKQAFCGTRTQMFDDHSHENCPKVLSQESVLVSKIAEYLR